jgi:hypothetical protein
MSLITGHTTAAAVLHTAVDTTSLGSDDGKAGEVVKPARSYPEVGLESAIGTFPGDFPPQQGYRGMRSHQYHRELMTTRCWRRAWDGNIVLPSVYALEQNANVLLGRP